VNSEIRMPEIRKKPECRIPKGALRGSRTLWVKSPSNPRIRVSDFGFCTLGFAFGHGFFWFATAYCRLPVCATRCFSANSSAPDASHSGRARNARQSISRANTGAAANAQQNCRAAHRGNAFNQFRFHTLFIMHLTCQSPRLCQAAKAAKNGGLRRYFDAAADGV